MNNLLELILGIIFGRYLVLLILLSSVHTQPINEASHTLGSCGYANNSILLSITKNYKKLKFCQSSISYSLQSQSKNYLSSVAKEACYNSISGPHDCINVVCYDPLSLQEEVSEFTDSMKVPHTLTLSTPELSEGLVGGKRVAKGWSQGTKRRWAIPDDHIAQNRQLCYNESLTASRKIVSLYEKYRSDSSTVSGYYVSVFRHALVHQNGQVGTHCSMFTGVEGCETRFNITATWWQTCHSLLASLGLDWDSFWFGADGSGNSTYRHRDSVPDPLRRDRPSGQMSMAEILKVCLFSSDSSRAQFFPPLRYPPYHDEVLVINGFFDSNYHHFLIDSLTRLSRHVDFLRANPHVKIHVRATEYSVAGKMREKGVKSESEIQRIMAEARAMRANILRVLGIEGDRLVSGNILARVVYLPRLSRCYFAIANPLEIRLLARQLLQGSTQRLQLSSIGQLPEDPKYRISDNPAGKLDYGLVDLSRDMYTFSGDELHRTQLVYHSGAGFRPSEPTAPPVDLTRKRMVVLQRHTLLYRAGNWRDWHDDIFNAICSALASVFVNHTVVAVRSNDAHYANCLECLIWQFSHADIVVGAHGAGLTNMIFMPPGSVVIETVGVWDGRMLPVCGYTGVLCAVNGHHHYIYYYDWEDRKRLLTNPHLNIFKPMKLASESLDFYRKVRTVS